MELKFAGIIFDGDGVVFDSEELSILAFRRTLERFGCTFTREQCSPFIGTGTASLLQTLREQHAVDIDQETYIQLRDEAYHACCLEAAGPVSMPGISELLDWLETNRLPFAIASSASPGKLSFNLERTGLASRFPVLVNGEEVAQGKPAPDIFLLAAKRIGVPIEQCLVLEDSLNGLHGALAAGARAIAIEGSHPLEELQQLTSQIYANPAALLRDLRNGDEEEAI